MLVVDAVAYLSNRLGDAKILVPLIPAMQGAVDMAVQVLAEYRSPILKNYLAYNLDPADSGVISLPSEFLSLAEVPYIIETKQRLKPMEQNRRHLLPETGMPLFYEVTGYELQVLPAPVDTVTLSTIQYQRPPALTSASEDIPFSGMFDYPLMELAGMVATGGMIVTASPDALALARKMIVGPMIDRSKGSISLSTRI